MSCMYWGWLKVVAAHRKPVIHLYTSCSYTFYGPFITVSDT